MIRLTILCALLYLGSVAFGDENKASLLPGRDVCGKQREEDRIYGGTEAQLGELPWLVLLGFRQDGSTDFFCGGSLINNRYVLTAAHCIDTISLDNEEGAPELIVRLGEHNIKTSEDCEGDTPGLEECSDAPIDIVVEKIIAHEDWAKGEGHGDIGLLRLKDPVSYSGFIRPLCLPITSDLQENDYKGTKVIVAGWGVTENKTDELSDVKLKVKLPVRSNKACSRLHKAFDIDIKDSQICAGGEIGKDSCQGDSGGPLMYRDKTDDQDNFISVGVVSFGIGCGGPIIPGVYTRTSAYIDWILENIEK